MTYEGSSTMPGCEEGVTWVVMNRPIYASKLELSALRSLRQGEKMQVVGAPNSRPPQDVGDRTVRTNLVPADNQDDDGHAYSPSVGGNGGGRKGRKKCPDLSKQVQYRPNHEWREEEEEENDEGGGEGRRP